MSVVIAVVLISYLLSMSGCGNLRSPSRDFSTEDLLLTQTLAPSNWERTRDAPVSIERFGFGNEKRDRWVGFVSPSDPERLVFANHFVLQFRSNGEAASWYESELGTWFNDNSIAISEPWHNYPELTFQPSFAEQNRIACTVNNVAGEQLVCTIMAQYEEFVVIFSSVIDSDTTSVSGFNEIVEQIDRIMVEHLQEG